MRMSSAGFTGWAAGWYNGTMHPNTDSYSYARARIWGERDDLLSGCRNGYVLVVSSRALSDDAHTALCKSMAALGYGTDACTYLVATPQGLPPDACRSVVEALDPRILIAGDAAAADLLAAAYREPFPLLHQVHLFGRPARAFESIDRLMESQDGHQTIWAALKTLPTSAH